MGVVVYSYNPCTKGVETEGSWVQRNSQVHWEFVASRNQKKKVYHWRNHGGH